jgi:hypothetical protein
VFLLAIGPHDPQGLPTNDLADALEGKASKFARDAGYLAGRNREKQLVVFAAMERQTQQIHSPG